MAARNRGYVVAGAKLIRISAIFQPLLQALIGLTFVAVLGVGGMKVRNGTITLGQFVEFNLYLVRLIWPMIAVGWVANLLQRGAASMARIESLFAEKPLAELVVTEENIPERHTPAASRSRTSRSPTPVPGVLRSGASPWQRAPESASDSRWRRERKEHAALAHPPTARAATRHSSDRRHRRARPVAGRLRRDVALVPQGSFLFSATLRENIALALPTRMRRPSWRRRWPPVSKKTSSASPKARHCGW